MSVRLKVGAVCESRAGFDLLEQTFLFYAYYTPFLPLMQLRSRINTSVFS
jgi:hypothetical protein